MRHSQHKAQGFWEASNPDHGMTAGETVQCVHCGGHFLCSPGSGKIRGWCPRCNGYVCGPQCEECVPQELRLERMDAGIPEEIAAQMPRPAVVSVPRKVTAGGVILGG